MKKGIGHLTLESMAEASWYNRWLVSKFRDYLGGKILEVGCGIGNFTQELLSYGQVYAIDIDQTYLEETKKATKGKARVGFGDIQKGNFFFGKEAFDCIVCLNVLEHLRDDKAALKNLSEFLNPGGYLIIIVPSHPSLYGKIDSSLHHFRRYQKKKLVKMIGNYGLKIVLARKLNLLGVLGWWISGRVLKSSKVNQGEIKIFNILAPLFLSIENMVEPPLGISILIIAQKVK